jgi:alpha-tubulin suppressor-like RCC1 family protein
MLALLNSLLDVPTQIVDRSVAACGSAEFGQTGLDDASAVAIERPLDPQPPLLSVACGGWSTFLGFADGAFAVLGLDLDGRAARGFQIAPIDAGPVARVAAGDAFCLLLRQNGDVTVRGDLPHAGALQPALKIFAKFGTAAAVRPDKTVAVVTAGAAAAALIALPRGEAAHTVEPLGRAGVAVLSESGRLFGFPGGAAEPAFEFDRVVSVASTRTRTVFLQADARIFEVVGGSRLLVSGVPQLPVRVYAGGAHFGCVTFEGSAFAWGTGTHGQLGTGSFLNTEDPREVRLPPGMRAIDACAGEEHTVFTIVAAAKFAQVLPKIMLREPLPAGMAALSVLPYGFVPPEFDIKF